jgi:hypothetical protein
LKAAIESRGGPSFEATRIDVKQLERRLVSPEGNWNGMKEERVCRPSSEILCCA